MVDFKSTYSTKDGFIHFCNAEGETLKQYHMERLIEYVERNSLNISYEWKESERYGALEHEVKQDASDYIDDNWTEVTEHFYNSLNKSEYKSQNLPQQTKAQTV